jgi:hypothetical protein
MLGIQKYPADFMLAYSPARCVIRWTPADPSPEGTNGSGWRHSHCMIARFTLPLDA